MGNKLVNCFFFKIISLLLTKDPCREKNMTQAIINGDEEHNSIIKHVRGDLKGLSLPNIQSN